MVWSVGHFPLEISPNPNHKPNPNSNPNPNTNPTNPNPNPTDPTLTLTLLTPLITLTLTEQNRANILGELSKGKFATPRETDSSPWCGDARLLNEYWWVNTVPLIISLSLIYGPSIKTQFPKPSFTKISLILFY